MSRLVLQFLGPPRIELDGNAIRPQRRKVLALLIYLAVTAKPHSREVLTELLFPRQDRSRAQAGFRQVLSILKTTIGEDWLAIDRFSVALPQQNVDTDLLTFRQLINRSYVLSHRGSELEAANLLTEAVRLYHGEFLSGFYLRDSPGFDDWQFFEQESIDQEYASSLEHLVEIHSARREYELAIKYGRSWLSLNPLDEGVHCYLMQLYSLAGQNSAARRQYEKCRTILRKELGETPSPDTERLLQKIQANQSTPFQGSRSQKSGTLPLPATSLIGRRQELATLCTALECREIRLITLTGPAGTGKTRLAIEAGAKLNDRFLQGIFFVDLTAARKPDQVIPVIAGTLELRQAMGQSGSLLDMLKSFLRSRRMLLILDNFEQVVSAADQVAELLAVDSEVKFLVTSRQPLHIRGEQEIPVPPLALPDEDHEHRDGWEKTDAVRLFADRAAAVRPAFSLNDTNIESVVEICSRLDGLPLAIELAASLVKALSPRDIVGALSDRLALLQRGYRDLPARQQTMSQAIDWSYALLEDGEKTLFTRLSIFIGGCTFEAAETVCTEPSGTSVIDVRQGLVSLVDKNLLRQIEGAGETRFWMLETIREYARKRLGEGAEVEAVLQQHAQYYLNLAEEAESRLHGADQILWLDKLEREHNNLQQVGDWFLDCGRFEQALRLNTALEWFWYRHGHFREGQKYLERALDQTAQEAPLSRYAHAARALGWIVFLQGDWPRSRTLYQQSMELFEKLEDKQGWGHASVLLGIVERWLGDSTLGTRHAQEGIRVARSVENPDRLIFALIGAYATTGGKFTGRVPQKELEEALTLSRQRGDLWGIAHALNGLGDLLREQGKYQEARARYEEALRGFRKIKDRWMIAWTLEGLGTTLYRDGNNSLSAGYMKESIRLFYQLGDRGNTAFMLSRLGMVVRRQGAHRRAALLLSASKNIQNVLLGRQAAQRLTVAPELSAACSEYNRELPSEWVQGQVMTLDQAVACALEESKD